MSELRLTAREGEALRVAQVLVGAARVGNLAATIDVASPSAALSEAVARTFTAGCLQLLIGSGGVRARTVLRDGRRHEGRLWDANLNESFDLRFTRATRAFWVQVAKLIVPLVHAKRRPSSPDQAEVTRADRATIKAAAPDGFDGVGDLVFFALAHEHIEALGLPPSLAEALRHEVRAAIPLPLLFAPDDPDIDERAVRGLLHTLTSPGPLRVIECIDDALVAAWMHRFRVLFLHASDRRQLVLHMRAFGRNLKAWLTLLDASGRMDLSRAVVRFLTTLAASGPQVNVDVRGYAAKLPGTASVADRDEVLQSMLTIVDLRTTLDDARRTLGDQRYGDERYDEAQIYVRMIESELTPLRGPLDALARTLSGAVG